MNKGKHMGRNLVLYTLIVVILVVLLVVINNMGSGQSDTNISFESALSTENRPIIGDPNASVTVYEFGDFKCPACKAWNDQVFPMLQEITLTPAK